MLCDIIQRMATCADCRPLAVKYGMALTDSRRHNANPRDWQMRLITTRMHLDDHLITVHSAWLPDRQQGCDVCEAWREASTDEPIQASEADHRAWHLCAPLREVCVPGNDDLMHLMTP